MSASSASTCASIRASRNAWWSRNRAVSALRSCGSFARSRALARSASTCGSATPPIRARIISRPDTPITSVATVASFTPASSRTLCSRLTSLVRARISDLR